MGIWDIYVSNHGDGWTLKISINFPCRDPHLGGSASCRGERSISEPLPAWHWEIPSFLYVQIYIYMFIHIYICLYIYIYIYTVYFLYTYVYQMAGDTPIFQTNPRWGRVASELHRIGKHMGTEAAKCGVFLNMAMDQKWLYQRMHGIHHVARLNPGFYHPASYLLQSMTLDFLGRFWAFWKLK